jgi:ubiquinone/menaquinone biosynthesis C-methylase UbiE
MFNNWISLSEMYYLLNKLYHEPEVVLKVISRLPLSRTGKIKATWSNSSRRSAHWWAVPAVQRRWNYLISGDSSTDYRDYICHKYLPDRQSLRGLSLGCGSGAKALQWAETNKFSHIDACDLSESNIKHARNMAAQKGLGGIVSFQADDVYNMEVQENSCDIIIGESSLHHFSPLETILQRTAGFLKQDGYFIVNEFVGPSRFQWTDRQLEIANSLLDIFPPKYKILDNSNLTKPKLIRPSRLRMILMDPSEAIESSNILPLLNKLFDVVEIRGYGGAILNLLLDGIAHHFLTLDDEKQRLLDICFEIEDLLMASGDIQNDFVVAVCRKRSPQ